jgi:hypothetical protein
MATKDKAKKAYKKPKVTQVKLEIGEAVLAACKGFVGDTLGKYPPKDCSNQGCKSYYSES